MNSELLIQKIQAGENVSPADVLAAEAEEKLSELLAEKRRGVKMNAPPKLNAFGNGQTALKK